jgi:hypothetical protein
MHVPLSLLVGFNICSRHFNQGFQGLLTWLGIRKALCVLWEGKVGEHQLRSRQPTRAGLLRN